MRLLRALAAALACALALTACIALPRSGPVRASDPDLPAPQGIGLFARGPEPGASPQQIVDGFLTASAAGFSDEFLVAREFLAGPAVQTWQPLEQVRIYADTPAPEFSRTDSGAVRLTVVGEAAVDSAGRYTELAGRSELTAEFALARVEGEWRIIELDDGVLLPQANFHSVYTQSALYFLTPQLGAFVPDVRWYPSHNLPTALVRGLLAGPSPWLQAGVVSMVPVGTRLTAESVLVSDGVAQVDLSTEALTLEPSSRALLVAQIERTLRDVSRVQELRVTVAGTPYEVPEPVPDLSSYPYTTAPLLAVSGDSLVEVIGGQLVALPGAEALGLDARDPAVGYETREPTTVLLDGPDRLVSAPTADSQPFLLTQGQNLVAPSVDRHGWVWTSPAENTGRLVAVQPDGDQVEVTVPWLAGGMLRAVRISREGARAVVVWDNAGTTVVDVAAVVRAADSSPRSLAEPVRIGDRLTDATDLAWIDEQTVAVLGTSEEATAPTIHLLPIGGPTSRLPAVDGAVSMTAGRGDRSIVVATGAGRLYERNGAAWRPTVDAVADPALPG